MTLIKTSLLNGVAVAVKVASALLLNKLLAVYVGPAGYAVIGQFQNAVSIVVNIAGGILSTGVTKATAQHFDDPVKQQLVWRTAIRFSFFLSLMTAITLILLSANLTQWILHRGDMSSVFVWLALTLPAMAANNLLIAIVNGKKEIGIYVLANIIGSFISVLMTGLLAISFGLYGTLVAFTLNPAIVLLSTTAIVVRRDWFKAKFLWGPVNRTALRELTGFGLMGLTAALASPLTCMMIRDYLVNSLGVTAAGYWQASWKISEIYLMLVTTTLSVYYLPRLAEIRTAVELKVEVIKVYRFVMPIVVIGAGSIYFLRNFIVNILFTKDFLPMLDLFAWQLAGDVIKIGSWILSYILLGRAMVKVYVITEIAFSVIFVFSSYAFVDYFGLLGVSIAYVFNYLIYWICMAFLVHREMNKMPIKV